VGEADGRAAEVEIVSGVEEGTCLLVILFASPKECEIVLGFLY